MGEAKTIIEEACGMAEERAREREPCEAMKTGGCEARCHFQSGFPPLVRFVCGCCCLEISMLRAMRLTKAGASCTAGAKVHSATSASSRSFFCRADSASRSFAWNCTRSTYSSGSDSTRRRPSTAAAQQIHKNRTKEKKKRISEATMRILTSSTATESRSPRFSGDPSRRNRHLVSCPSADPVCPRVC